MEWFSLLKRSDAKVALIWLQCYAFLLKRNFLVVKKKIIISQESSNKFCNDEDGQSSWIKYESGVMAIFKKSRR